MLTQIYYAIWHHYVPIFHQLKIIKRNVAIIHVYLLIWQLTHRGWVTHIRVSRVCYLSFKYVYYFVAFSAPNHYLNHCELFGNCSIIKNKLQWSLTQYKAICIRENQFKIVVNLALNTKWCKKFDGYNSSQSELTLLHHMLFMMTSSNGNIFRVTGHLCEGFTGEPVNSPHKGQWRRALMFSLICAWISSWVNNREAGDLRRHRAHYNVIVMWLRAEWLFALNKNIWY